MCSSVTLANILGSGAPTWERGAEGKALIWIGRSQTWHQVGLRKGIFELRTLRAALPVAKRLF